MGTMGNGDVYQKNHINAWSQENTSGIERNKLLEKKASGWMYIKKRIKSTMVNGEW